MLRLALTKKQFVELIAIMVANNNNNAVEIKTQDSFISYTDSKGIIYQFAGTKNDMWDCVLELREKHGRNVSII